MLPRPGTHFPIALRKLVSLCVIACFPFSGISAAAPGPKVAGPENLPTAITIPEALGQIETQHFAGPDKPFVFFVQDAHSVLDAQHNIRRLIEYLEKEYGVRAVGIEGGEGKLDPLVFRAFPDAFIKEKVMEDYLGRGEITGAGVAAIFSPVKSAYYGIEDWKLYGENYKAYLSSVSERSGILSALDEIKISLDEKQGRIFSPELSAHQKKTADFYSETSHLLEYLQHLRSLAESLQPGSAEEIGVRYPHLSVLWETVARDRAAPSLGMDASMRRMAKAFQEHYLPRLDRRTQMEFNGMHQQFLSGQLDAGKFLRVLVETGKSAGIQAKLTPEMKDLLGHTERLSQIKGTRLFDELEALAASLENQLIQNPMQKMLADDYRRLRRLTSLAKLELSRDQLDQYQADAEGHLALLDTDSLRQTLAPALTFYKLALERDRVFHQKMEQVMKREKVRAAAVLAGGFHARGFEEQLRSKGYSFAVITPKIDSLEGSGLYEGVMSGKLSYGKDVTRSLYEAFVRHASASLVQELNEPDFRKMMKLWRDEVIRLLAAEGRTGEAGEYTRALDALSAVYLKKFGPGAGSKTLPEVLEALDKELAGFRDSSLKGLWSRFESGLDDFFASQSAAPVPGAALGTTVMQQIRTSLPVNDPLLVAITQGPDAVPALDLSLPETRFPASSTREIQNALSDLMPVSSQGIVNLPEVLELREQLRLAAQAGDQLGIEAKTNQAELVRVLESRVDEIVRRLPAEQRSQQGDAALRAAIIDSLRKDFPYESAEPVSNPSVVAPQQQAAPIVIAQGPRSELRAEQPVFDPDDEYVLEVDETTLAERAREFVKRDTGGMLWSQYEGTISALRDFSQNLPALADFIAAQGEAGLENLRQAGVEIPALTPDSRGAAESVQKAIQGFLEAPEKAAEAIIRMTMAQEAIEDFELADLSVLDLAWYFANRQNLDFDPAAVQTAVENLQNNPDNIENWNLLSKALSRNGRQAALSQTQIIAILNAYSSTSFKVIPKDVKPRTDPEVSRQDAAVALFQSAKSATAVMSLREKILMSIGERLSRILTDTVSGTELAESLGAWAQSKLEAAAPGASVTPLLQNEHLGAAFKAAPSLAGLMTDASKAKALLEILTALRVVLDETKSEKNNFLIPLGQGVSVRVDSGSYRRFIVQEVREGKTTAFEIKVPGELRHKLEVSPQDFLVSEAMRKNPLLAGMVQETLGVFEYPAGEYTFYGMKVDSSREDAPVRLVVSEYPIEQHGSRSRLNNFISSRKNSLTVDQAREISRQVARIAFEGVTAAGWTGHRDLVHFQNFSIVEHADGRLEIQLVNDLEGFKLIENDADEQAVARTYQEFRKIVEKLPGSIENAQILQDAYEKALTVRNEIRSELRTAVQVQLLPTLEQWAQLGIWEQWPDQKLEGRYEATADYVRLDGVFYILRGEGYEQALAKAREQIVLRGQDEKIVVLLEGKQYRGALTFKHHFHTALSLIQLANVAPALRDQTLIDLGAGSGVLGITALLRDGARNVIAVDLDAESLGQAQEALALTEQANSLAPGTLSSKFISFPLSYEQFGQRIMENDFAVLRSEVSAQPVIITNNHRPWGVEELFHKNLGAWLLQDNAARGLPEPSHIIVAGASYEAGTDYEDRSMERMEQVSKDSYREARLPDWRFMPRVLKDYLSEDLWTDYVGATYQSPRFSAELQQRLSSERSELRSDDAADRESLRQKMAAQVEGNESVLMVSTLGLSESEMDLLASDIAQLDHEAFGGTGAASEFNIAKVLGAFKRDEIFYVLVDKSGVLKGYIQSTINEADRSSYLYKLAARPGAGRGSKLLDRYFLDLSSKKIERAGWVADGFSAGFYTRYLTGKMAYDVSSAATNFAVDLTTYDFTKNETKLASEVISSQQAYLSRISARENEVRTLFDALGRTAGDFRISVDVEGETLELPALVDADGHWTVMGSSEMGSTSAKDGLLRVLMYNGSSKLTRTDGSPVIEASGFEDFTSIQKTSELSPAALASGPASPKRQAVLDLFDASIREQNLPAVLPSDYFVLAPVLVKLPEEVDALADVLRRSRDSGYLSRTIFVDDGSDPELQERMSALREQFPDFNYIQFDRNQQKEVALYAALHRLRNEYQARGVTFPSHFVSVDADSALLSPSGNAAETAMNLSQTVEQLKANPGIGAAGIEIQGALTRGKSGFIEWLQAMNYYATMKVGKLISFMINPSIPGGGVIYRSEAFEKAIEDTVAKDKSWSYLSGPMKLRDGIAEQGLRIGAPRQEVVVKTKIFPGFLDLVDQQQRWWKINDFPRSLKILLGVLGAVLAGSVIQVTINVGILPILAALMTVTIYASVITGIFTAAWAAQHWLRGERDQVGLADLLLVPAYITLFFLAIPTALLSRTVTGFPAARISVRPAQTQQTDGPQARSELRSADSIESKLEKIADQSPTLLNVPRPGLFSRFMSRFQVIREIPENFPAVIVTPEGFRLLTGDTADGSILEGALISGTEKAAANLARSGVRWIMGDKLRDKKFVRLAGEESFESPEAASQFLRANRIHQFQESDFTFVRDPRMNDEQEKKLFETARRDLNSMLGDDASLAEASAPFVPLVASYLQNLLAGNYENIQRTLSHHFAYSPDGIYNHLGRDNRTRSSSPGAYKALHFVSLIQQYSKKFNEAAGSQIPGRILASDLDLMLASYYTPEFTHGFLEKLYQVHETFAHKDGQSVFLKNLISVLKGTHHVWMLSDSYGRAEAVVNAGLENLQYALTNNSDLKNFLSLYVRLTTRNLTFGDKTFRFESAQFLSETESEAEFQGKNESFKVNYRAEDGTRQSVLLKNVSLGAVRNDQFATGVTRLLGLPTYRVSVAQKVSENPRSDAVWEMIQMRPSYTLGISNRHSGYKAENLDKLFSGSAEQTASRLQQIGSIFAVEYFGARDSKMKHILIDENTGEPFRIDWEFMFFNDASRPAGMTAKLEDIPHVLAGDERDFLRAVLNSENGLEKLQQVILGFDRTLGRMMSDLSKGESESAVLQLVNSVYKDDTRLHAIKQYIQEQFYKADGTPRTLEEVRTMIGLSPADVANPSFRRSELRSETQEDLTRIREKSEELRIRFESQLAALKPKAPEEYKDFTAKYTALLDSTLKSVLGLYESTGLTNQISLMVTGSLARRSPAYGTDIDVVILSNDQQPAEKSVIEHFVDTLEGVVTEGVDFPTRILPLSRPVYTPNIDQLLLDLEELDVISLRNLLDSRFIAGNQAVYQRFQTEVLAAVVESLESWIALDTHPGAASDLRFAWRFGDRILEDELSESQFLRALEKLADTDLYSEEQIDTIRNLVMDQNSSYVDLLSRSSFYFHYLEHASSTAEIFDWTSFNAKQGLLGSRTLNHLVSFGRIITGLTSWNLDGKERRELFDGLVKGGFLTDKEAADLTEIESFNNALKTAVNLSWEAAYPGEALVESHKDTLNDEIIPDTAARLGLTREQLKAEVEAHASRLRAIVRSKVEDYREASRSELRQALAGAAEDSPQTRLEDAQRWIRNQLLAEEDRANVFTARNAPLIQRISEEIRTGAAGFVTEFIGEAGGVSVYRVTGLPESSELLVFTSQGEIRDIALSTNEKEMSYALNGQGLTVPLTDPDARRVNRYISVTRAPREELIKAVLPEIKKAVTGTLEIDRLYVPAAGLLKEGQSLADMAAESPILQHVLQSLSRLPAGTSEDNLNFRLSKVYEFAVDESVTNAYFDGRRSHFQMAFRLEDFSDDINPTVYHELQHDNFRSLSVEKRQRLENYLLANEPEIHAAMKEYNPVRVLDEFLAHVVEMLAAERRQVKGIIFGTEDEIILLKIKAETIEYLVSEGVLPQEAVSEFLSRSELRHTGDSSEDGSADAVRTRGIAFNFNGTADELIASVLSQPREIAETLHFFRMHSSGASRDYLTDRYSAVSETTNQKPTVYIGDLHGRTDVLLAILRDTVKLPEGEMTILEALQKGLVNLHQVGDVVHPNGDYESQEKHLNTFALFTALIALKNMAPDNVQIIQGNHESGSVGPKSVTRSGVNLDEVFEEAVIERAGQGQGWSAIPNWDKRVSSSTRAGRDVGRLLYNLYQAAVLAMPTVADNHSVGSGIAMVHAGPAVTRDYKIEDLATLDVNKADGSLYDQLLWTRAAAEKGYEAVEHLDEFADKLGLSLVINGHTPFSKFKDKGSAVSIYAFNGENVFGVLRGTKGAFQVVLDASNVETHAGYLFLDVKQGIPNKLEDFRGPDGHSAFRIIDVVKGGKSRKGSLKTPEIPVKAEAKPKAAAPAASPAAITREPRVFAVGNFFFRIQLEGTALVILESDRNGNVVRERARKTLQEGDSFVIGRDPDMGADLILGESAAISRVHAFIRLNNGVYTIEDKNISRNGTFAAGQRIFSEQLNFSESSGKVQEAGVRQRVFAVGTQFQDVTLNENGHLDPVSVLVPSTVPSGTELVEEVRAYIEKYITNADQKKWALQNLSDPRILPLILPYMEAARRANILFVVSQEIPNPVIFRFTIQKSLEILREVFDSLPKELLWEMTAPQGYEYTVTEGHVLGYQKMDDTLAGGAIGKFQDKKSAMETIVHEVLGHKRHNTKALKFEFSKDGRQIRRLDGLNDWQIIVSGLDWARIAKINGVEQILPLTKEMREALESGNTVSFGANALQVSSLPAMPDQDVLNLMRRLFVHGFAYYNDLREILAFTAMGDDLTVPGPAGERNNGVKYEATRRLLLESSGRVHSVPVDPVNQVFRSYEYNSQTGKFDVFYVKNLGTEEKPDWHKVLWHMTQKRWIPFEATAPDELRPQTQTASDEIPEAISAEPPIAAVIPEAEKVQEAGEVVSDGSVIFAASHVSQAVIRLGNVSFRIARDASRFMIVEDGSNGFQSRGPFDLQPGRILRVGRDPGNDIVLQSPKVSLNHASFEIGADGAIEIVDKGSTNGTWVDGARTSRYTVLWESTGSPANEDEGFDELTGGLAFSDEEAEAIKERQKAQQQAAIEAAAKASKSPDEYLKEHIAQNLDAVNVLQSFFDRNMILTNTGKKPDAADIISRRDASNLVIGPLVGEEEIVEAFRPYFVAVLRIFSEGTDPAVKARVYENARALAGFFTAFGSVENSLKIRLLLQLSSYPFKGDQAFKKSGSHQFIASFYAQSRWGGSLAAAVASAKVDRAIDGRFQTRSELRLAESAESRIPPNAVLYLDPEDLKLLENVQAGIQQDITALKTGVVQRGLAARVSVEASVDGFIRSISALLREESTVEAVVSHAVRADFESDLTALLEENALAQGLTRDAAGLLSQELVPQTAGLIRSVLTAAVMTGDMRVLTSSGLVTVELSPEARALLAKGSRADFEAAYAKLRASGREDLPAQFFLPVETGAKESWFIQSSFLRSDSQTGLAPVQQQLESFLSVKNVPLTFGYTAGTPEERLARELARLFAGTLTVGRRFGEAFRTSKMGYHVNQADQIVFVLNAESGRIQDPLTETSRKSRGIVGREDFISPDLLNHKEYLLLADLIVQSPYLYGQLKSKDGFSFGVMDEEVLNGFLGFLNDLAKAGAAEAAVRASA